ncbi:MAG: hypothetical protein OEM52_00595 [bacterium]|nr:hypothetical protein [bacterium]
MKLDPRKLAVTYVAFLLLSIANITSAISSTPKTIPSPFFFTENKGQWDARVLYKCQAKNGMTWFLERDGITLLLTQPGARDSDFGAQGRDGPPRPPIDDPVRRTFLSDDVMENDLPEMLRRHPARKNVPMKSHALKFHFVKGEGLKVKGEGLKVKGEGSKVKGEGSKVNGARETKEVSENLDQSFSTQHPSPYTLHQSFSTLHPTPYTLHQSFSTLHRAETRSVEAQGELPWKNNYFLGNDSSRWAPNCRNFSSVVYREVWERIDVEWYENDGKLEFDFIVHPGFDPNQIRMSVEGLEGDRISGFGAPESLLSLRGSAATKQSHLDNGERGTGDSRGGRPCPPDSRGVPRTPAVTGVSQTILSDKYSSRGRPSGSPAENVRDLLRDSRTTEGTVHRQKMSDDNTSRGGRPCPPDGKENVRDLLRDSRTTGGTSLSLRGMERRIVSREADSRSEMTKQSHLEIGNREPETGSSRVRPQNSQSDGKENVRDMVPESRTTVGISSRTPNTESRTPTNGTPNTEFRTPTNGTPIAQSPLPITELLLPTSLGELRTALPSVYQISANGTRNEIDATFQLTDQNTFGITLPNGYNPDHSLRIDPLIYSTYLGGSGADYGSDLCEVGNGNVVVLGSTQSFEFPITIGSYQSWLNGSTDWFVTELNSSGSQLVFSTYIGGTLSDYNNRILRAGDNSLIITGYTRSTDFPEYNRLGVCGSIDGLIVTLSSNGSQLLTSTRIGGSSDDDIRPIIPDETGGYYVGCGTLSVDYPITANAFDTSANGQSDGCIMRFNNNFTQILYSSYFGGSMNENITDVCLSPAGGIVVTGLTLSANLPVTSTAIDSTISGDYDCFVAKFDASLSSLLYNTFLGGLGYDSGSNIVCDSSGIVVTGAAGAGFPVTSCALDTTYHGGMDCHVTKLRLDGLQLVFCTYLGGIGDDHGYCIDLDDHYNYIVAGRTQSVDFPTTAMSLFPTNQGQQDGFALLLNSDGSQLLYSTFLGGLSEDRLNSLTLLRDSVITVVGSTASVNYPITNNSYDTTYNGGSSDCIVTRLFLNIDTNDVANEQYKLPELYSLSQNYPNPFNSSTTISYSLPKPGNG